MTELWVAPMEGLTTVIWRKVFRECFGGMDGFVSPFLSPNSNYSFQTKELREISARETDLVPQMVCNRAEHFSWACEEMLKMGYSHVNLNLGCPSGTLVAKRKGSGMLTDPRELDEFLNGIFKMVPDGCSVSVKTRIGRNYTEEWPSILRVFNRYPIERLIIHPRIQKEFYTGSVHRDAFDYAVAHAAMPLMYNGDLTTVEQIRSFMADYPEIPVMVGRGLLMDPALFRKMKGGTAATKEELMLYHALLIDGYRSFGFDDTAIFHRMKEMWTYLAASFECVEPYLKKIHKVNKYRDYEAVVNELFAHCAVLNKE